MNFTFLNTPILLFDSDSNQTLSTTCKSAVLSIHIEGFENLVLLKEDRANCINCDCIVIPFASIWNLEISEFKTVSTSPKIAEQLSLFDHEELSNTSGFVIPLKYLDQTALYIKDNLVNSLRYNQAVASEVLKARHVDCEIKFFNDLIDMKQLLPNYFSKINYSCLNYSNSKSISRYVGVEQPEDIDIIDTKLSSIFIDHKLSPEEFNLVKELLLSRRTRFNISSVRLKFNLLSECLDMLAICAECPEMEFIEISYSKSDLEKEQEEVKKAVRKIKRQFGLIKNMKIIKA